MQPLKFTHLPGNPSATLRLLRLVVLLLPTLLLVLGGVRSLSGKPNNVLLLGALAQFLLCYLGFLSQRSWWQPLGTPVIAHYLFALGWLWLGTDRTETVGVRDWYFHLAQSVLLVIPVVIFALQTLLSSHALAVRRAYALVERLATRQDWPAELGDCRALPEVKALRDALHLDAGPALTLLADPRPQIRVAALAALEFRKQWKKGQAERVLDEARNAVEAPVRAAAVAALGNVDEKQLVEALAYFLRDISAEVRHAALEALLWDTERRWSWIRNAVHDALADPELQDDGPLWLDTQELPADALNDLSAWVGERGVLASRAALTLGAHYTHALAERPTSVLIFELVDLLENPLTPSVFRLELARILIQANHVERQMLRDLLDPSNPVPLRLLAADALLARGKQSEAVATLRDIARVPNREIALATAQVLQRRLGLDMGLAIGEAPPPILSRRAIEVTRCVMHWALEPFDDKLKKRSGSGSGSSSSAVRL